MVQEFLSIAIVIYDLKILNIIEQRQHQNAIKIKKL